MSNAPKKSDDFEKEINEFENDIKILARSADDIIKDVYPYFAVNDGDIKKYLNTAPEKLLDSMSFFKLRSFTTEDIDNVSEYLAQKFERLIGIIHSLNAPIVYGIVSRDGQTDLILGIEDKTDYITVKSVVEGVLSGVDLKEYKTDFESRVSLRNEKKSGGIISGVPITYIDGKRQFFDISAVMRSMNGRDYTILFVSRPCGLPTVQEKISSLLETKDRCFEVSKRNIARQRSESKENGGSKSETTDSSETTGNSFLFWSSSKTMSQSESSTINWATTLGISETISVDKQNSLALELIKYCDKAVERLQKGMNIGMWETAIAYSARDKLSAKVLDASVCGELSKSASDTLPFRKFPYQIEPGSEIYIPQIKGNTANPLMAPITSDELGMICTPPFESAPDFERRLGKLYPMVGSDEQGIDIGCVSDGYRPIKNMKFTLSDTDLNKHTFVCGITGSGKTTTVKGILKKVDKPFMVIESAKKEYRNINLNSGRPTIYTLGKSEINSLQFNPFYIQKGINLQSHIDYLKDLFNAAFSFYGPMPYILERCLHNIYKKKGWNMTLGYHPFLINSKSWQAFSSDEMTKKYNKNTHKYLFPTMLDLKEEVKQCIETELNYEGEVRDNIKTAMLARLDSLCVGAKGFMFNTTQFIDMEKMMNENVVFELEGLADDSDKAFCVGLLVIFINEYRQIFKDEYGEKSVPLQHLLVIEEAHRLLKNIETERVSENLGNPKGKAVEHFTNMIAEMRSYGQGVIIAEQIPEKLAPDVIKNSSNKIAHRLISGDDQSIIANTIGMKSGDSVYLGNLRAGTALCHKEGMSMPVQVFVDDTNDDYETDNDLIEGNDNVIFEKINYSIINETLSNELDMYGLKLLNTLLIEENTQITASAIDAYKTKLADILKALDTQLIFCNDKYKIIGELLAEKIISYLTCGVYRLDELMDDDMCEKIKDMTETASEQSVSDCKSMLKKAYMQDCGSKCRQCVSELIKNILYSSKKPDAFDIDGCIKEYFAVIDDDQTEAIRNIISTGGGL